MTHISIQVMTKDAPYWDACPATFHTVSDPVEVAMAISLACDCATVRLTYVDIPVDQEQVSRWSGHYFKAIRPEDHEEQVGDVYMMDTEA